PGVEPVMPGGLAGAVLDLDLGDAALDADAARGAQQQLVQLAADQRGDQLQRLEKSLLRLERSNLQVLTLLQQLVSALSRRKPGAEKASADEGKEGAR
ncbi:MAG: hypothetical protein ACK5Y0_01175, partial [Pseudomonadota bacterium]